MKAWPMPRTIWISLPLVVLFSISTNVKAEPDSRPNILFAFADDWGRNASIYGKLEPGGVNDVVQTPNFDRIANEGVLFKNAFVNAPSCTPCRSSLLSGQHFFRTGQGAILSGAVWDSKIPSYPLLLRDNGYHIGHTHKVWSPGTPVNAPYGEKKYAYNLPKSGKVNGFSQFVSNSKDIEQAKQVLYDYVRANFEEFLKANKDGKPFCYWFGPTNVHRKWIQGSGKELWKINPDDLKGKMPPFLPDVPLVRQDYADYLGEVHAFDACLGVLIKVMEEKGILDNTLIAVSGDHGAAGFPNGKCNLYDFGTAVSLAFRWGGKIPAGRVVDDFVSLPDLAPTFLEVGGVKPPAVMTAKSLMNVLTSTKQGQVDSTRSFVIAGRERHVSGARKGNLPYPQRCIRTTDYLYIRNFKPDRWPMGDGPGYGFEDKTPTYKELEKNTFAAFGDFDASPTKAWIFTHRNDPKFAKYFAFSFAKRPAEELFDLKKDPHQIENVAFNNEYAATKTELSEKLMKILIDAEDPRVTGDGTTFEKSPYTDEYIRHSRKKKKKKK